MIENYELLRSKISGKTYEEICAMDEAGELDFDQKKYQLAESRNKETVSGLVVKFTKEYRKKLRKFLGCDADINALVKLDRLLSEGYMVTKKEKTEMYLNRKQFLRDRKKAEVTVYTLTKEDGTTNEILLNEKSLLKGSYRMCQRKSDYYEMNGESILEEESAKREAYLERKRRREARRQQG